MLLYGPEPGPPPWPTELGVKGDASEPGGGPFQEAGVPGSSSVVVAANGVFRRLQPESDKQRESFHMDHLVTIQI